MMNAGDDVTGYTSGPVDVDVHSLTPPPSDSLRFAGARPNDVDTGTAVWTRVATFHADPKDFGVDAEAVSAAIDAEVFKHDAELRLRTTTTGNLELWRRRADDE